MGKPIPYPPPFLVWVGKDGNFRVWPRDKPGARMFTPEEFAKLMIAPREADGRPNLIRFYGSEEKIPPDQPWSRARDLFNRLPKECRCSSKTSDERTTSLNPPPFLVWISDDGMFSVWPRDRSGARKLTPKQFVDLMNAPREADGRLNLEVYYGVSKDNIQPDKAWIPDLSKLPNYRFYFANTEFSVTKDFPIKQHKNQVIMCDEDQDRDVFTYYENQIKKIMNSDRAPKRMICKNSKGNYEVWERGAPAANIKEYSITELKRFLQ